MSKTIETLSQFIEVQEKTQSSHWKKYHSNFKYKNGELSGLEGFGTINKPLTGIKKIIYNLFLNRHTQHKN